MISIQKILFLTLFFFAILLCSCDVEDCISTKSSGLVVEYYSFAQNAKLPMKISYLDAEGNDSILIQNDTLNISSSTLFLNPATNTTTFFYDIVPYIIDTLETNPLDTNIILSELETHFIEFSYERRQRIITPECGVEQSFYKLKIVDHDFDSAAVVNDTIDRFNPVNVNIYF